MEQGEGEESIATGMSLPQGQGNDMGCVVCKAEGMSDMISEFHQVCYSEEHSDEEAPGRADNRGGSRRAGEKLRSRCVDAARPPGRDFSA